MRTTKQITRWDMAPCPEAERIQARMDGRGLEPHFHDAWSFGVVLAGNCTFKSRGEKQQERQAGGQAAVDDQHAFFQESLHAGGLQGTQRSSVGT